MKMPLVYADEEEKERGWTLSCSFLKTIQKKMKETQSGGLIPSLEQIEEVLLAYEKIK